MQVRVEEIREQGLSLTESLTQEMLTEALRPDGKDTGFLPRGPGEVKARFVKLAGGRVLLEGSFTVPLVSPCKRCLQDVTLDVPASFTLTFVPEGTLGLQAEEDEDDAGEDSDKPGSFRMDEADLEPFDGKTIDLDPVLREQVLLALPMDAVCKDDCRGLCSVCGQNLNEKDCACEKKLPDPRLLQLRDIKLKN